MTTREPFKFNLISAKNLYEKQLPKIEYLVDKLIIKRGLTYYTGPPASFKTCFLLYLAIFGASRKDAFGFKINEPFRTLWIDEENGQINTKDKLCKLLKGNNVDIKELDDNKLLFAIISNFKITSHHFEGLNETIEKFKPDLIVIDNIARCIVGDERNEEDVSKILDLVKPIIEKRDVSFIVIHHTRKGDANSLEDISGSRDFGAQCDNAFLLKQCDKKDKVKTFLLKQTKAKHGIEMEPINFTVQGDDTELFLEYIGTASENINNLVDEIVVQFKLWYHNSKVKQFTTEESNLIMFGKGFRESNIKSARKKLEAEGSLKKLKRGVWEWTYD